MSNRIATFAAVFVLCAVVHVPAAGAQTTTALLFDSETGDWIGGGQKQTWTDSNLKFGPFSWTTPSQVVLRADNFASGGSTWWDLNFVSPAGTVLAPGIYEYAGDATFKGKSRPGLNIGGSGRGCTATGRFVIYEVAFDSSGKLVQFAADFEQHCDGRVPGLFGAIRFNSTRGNLNPFDGAYPVYSLTIDPPINGTVTAAGIGCGGRASDCEQAYGAAGAVTLTAMPAPGHVFVGWTGYCTGSASSSVVIFTRQRCAAVFDDSPEATGPQADDLRLGSLFLYSQRGDYIGQGIRQLWTRTDTEFLARPAFSTTPSRWIEVGVTTPDGDSWNLDFAAPSGQVLHVGDYEGATRFPFQAATGHGLSVWGHGRGCNTLTGRFRVYEVQFDGAGQVISFAADFEQHCEGGASALFGAIRYNSTRSSVLPFDGAFLPRPDMAIDVPLDGSTVGQTFQVGGWALNKGELSGTGVDAVHVYALPLTGGAPIFLGVAAYGAPRSDLAASFGSQFLNSGFALATSPELTPGKYLLAAYARDTISGTFNAVRTATITVVVSVPLVAIDRPADGARIVGALAIDGWAIDAGALTGSGVDAIHVYAYEAGSSTPIFLGATTTGIARPDLAAAFGSQFGSAGYHLDAGGLASGTYTIWVYARSTVTGRFTAAPRTIAVTSAAMSVDTPGDGFHVANGFLVAGWALDAAAPSGTGVDAVHVWAIPADGGAPLFVGAADLGVSRPDVGAIYGTRFSNSGFNLVAAPLPPGTYTLAVSAHSTATGAFTQMKTVSIVVP